MAGLRGRTAQAALKEWLKFRRAQGDPSSPYVFSNLNGKGRGKSFTARLVQRVMLEARQQAGLPEEKCTPYKLRHSHVTAFIDAGRRIEEVKEVLEHASIATTQIYTHVNKSSLKAAAESLPNVL